MDYSNPSRGLTVANAQRISVMMHQCCDRIRRIRLSVHESHLQNFLTAFIDKEFPMLEYLFISLPESHSWPEGLKLPNTFRAPRLRHLILIRFPFSITSPLLPTTVHLGTLSLNFESVGHCRPGDLLKLLALLPRLETLRITFHPLVRDNGIGEQVPHTRFITHVNLPNLRWFVFQGTSPYLEALLPGMTTPLLEKLKIALFGQLTFSVSYLLRFMITTENLILSRASFNFYRWGVTVWVYPHERAKMYAFYVRVLCKESDQQLFFVAQLSEVLSPVFSAVAELAINHYLPSTQRNEANYTQWRKLFRSFSSVKTLRMPNVLIEDLSRSLRSDGEQPLELLPQLQVLVCPMGSDAFSAAAFINGRKVAGHLVRLSTQ